MSATAHDPRASIEQHSRSFALASRLLPPRVGRDAAAVYAWCRRADDAIDEAGGAPPRERLARLRSELLELYAGAEPTDAVLAAFARVIHRTGIPSRYPWDLLAGMEMDVAGHRYQCQEDLLLYCYRVASTVGLMMCHVMGVSHPAAFRHAAHLGLAMQLTNICRDVAEDWQRQRLYLPSDSLCRHGAPALAEHLGRPFPDAAANACRAAIIDLLALADRYYASSDGGLAYLSFRCALGVNAARRIYSAIGTRIARQDHDPRAPRAVVPAHTKFWLCARAALSACARRSRISRHGGRAVPLAQVQLGTELISL